MNIKLILANFITRLIGALIGIFGAWLFSKTGIDISVLLTPSEAVTVAIAIGVVGSGALLDFAKRIFKVN